MTTTACTCASQPLPQTVTPVLSLRPSLILAEAARQRRSERRQRREGRARRTVWFALFDRRPFDLVRTRATSEVVFSGGVPLVYTSPLR